MVYLLLGALAVEMAVGHNSSEADTSGVFQALARHALGKALLVGLVIGFLSLALWQGASALHKIHEVPQRLVSALKALVYLGLAGSAGAVLAAGHGSSGNQQAVDFTATLMKAPLGRFLVGAVGLGIMVGGVVFVVKGVRHHNDTEVDLRGVPRDRKRPVELAGLVGMSARGVVVAAIGYFIVQAAVTFNPGQAKGIDGALHSIVQQPFGPILLVIVALGLVSFGCYSFLEIPYVKV